MKNYFIFTATSLIQKQAKNAKEALEMVKAGTMIRYIEEGGKKISVKLPSKLIKYV